MGRRITNIVKKPVFMHDNMQSIIPDIMTARDVYHREERHAFPVQKPLPLAASGKKYTVLPCLEKASSQFKYNKDTAVSRPNPCISPDASSEPEIKKPRVPLACMDIQTIKEKMNKAEKKEKKAQKKKARPAPKQITVNAAESQSEQKNDNLPLVHIPHPPDHPVDMSRPRRIVRFKRPVSFQNITPEQFVNMATSVLDNCDGIQPAAGLEYLDPVEELYREPQSDPYSDPYVHPVDTLPMMMDLSYGDVQPSSFVGYTHPVDSFPGIVEQQMQPDPVLGHRHPVYKLPGILDLQVQPNPVFGHAHQVDTLPGIDNQPPDNGYYGQSLPFVGLGSLKQDFYGEVFAGYPEIRRTGQLGSYGEAGQQSHKGKLAPIPSVTPKDPKINNRPRKSTPKQRPKNANRKLISINSCVNI